MDASDVILTAHLFPELDGALSPHGYASRTSEVATSIKRCHLSLSG
jgi:hypothetical protein